MPKATRANDGTTPKKRSRKTTPEVGNGTQPEIGNGTQAAQPVTTTSPKVGNGTQPENRKATQAAPPLTTSPEFAHASQASPVVEEKIRARAYELYLQRGGKGGSPEQDWLRAKEEICGQQRTA
jgi:hypothetical protein